MEWVITFSPLGFHDVAVINTTCPKTLACEGMCNVTLTVTVENQGDFTETFNVTAYANTTVISTQTVTLNPGENTTLIFKWDTTSAIKYSNYTLKAIADIVQNEMETADNTFINGKIIIAIVGDVNGDKKVNMKDLYSCLILHFGCEQGQPCYVPNYDIDGDGKINMKDIYQAILHFGKAIHKTTNLLSYPSFFAVKFSEQQTLKLHLKIELFSTNFISDNVKVEKGKTGSCGRRKERKTVTPVSPLPTFTKTCIDFNSI